MVPTLVLMEEVVKKFLTTAVSAIFAISLLVSLTHAQAPPDKAQMQEMYLQRAGAIRYAAYAKKAQLLGTLKEYAPAQIGIGMGFATTAEGTLATYVREGKPASLAGIKEDDQLVSLNGKPLTIEVLYELMEALTRANNEKTVGTSFTFVVTRGDKELTIEVKTAVLRRDKTVEATALAEKFENESKPLIEAVEKSLDAFEAAVKAGKISFDENFANDENVKAVQATIATYVAWVENAAEQMIELLSSD